MATTEFPNYFTKDITYSTLVDRISQGTLEPGTRYLITDYRTTYIQDVSGETLQGSVEPIIVESVASDKISSKAISTIYPEDVIFYDPSNNNPLYPGSTHGIITRRIDKNMNDVAVDFRAVLFRRYAVDVPEYSAGATYARKAVVAGVDGKTYVSLWADNTGNALSNPNWWLQLPFNNGQPCLPLTSGIMGIGADTGSFVDYLMFQAGAENNFIGGDTLSGGNNYRATNNVFMSDVAGNLFMARCERNHWIGTVFSCRLNLWTQSIANSLQNCYAAAGNFRNVFCGSNYGNTFNNLSDNYIGTGFIYNDLGGNFSDNIVCNNFRHNEVAPGVSGLSIRPQTQINATGYSVKLQKGESGEGIITSYDSTNTLQMLTLPGRPE